jgi:hypothetical protein
MLTKSPGYIHIKEMLLYLKLFSKVVIINYILYSVFHCCIYIAVRFIAAQRHVHICSYVSNIVKGMRILP